MTLGPLEYTVIGFEGNRFNGEIAREIQKVVDKGIIRLVDVVFITKDIDGEVTVIELDNRDDPRFAGFAPLLAGLRGLFTADDIAAIGEDLPVNTSALAVLFEHRWAEHLKDAMTAAGGFLMSRTRSRRRSSKTSTPNWKQSRPDRDPLERSNDNDATQRRRDRRCGRSGPPRRQEGRRSTRRPPTRRRPTRPRSSRLPQTSRQRGAQAQAGPGGPAVDPMTAQLENLANLHTQGILSDEEYAAAKAKALGI